MIWIHVHCIAWIAFSIHKLWCFSGVFFSVLHIHGLYKCCTSNMLDLFYILFICESLFRYYKNCIAFQPIKQLMQDLFHFLGALYFIYIYKDTLMKHFTSRNLQKTLIVLIRHVNSPDRNRKIMAARMMHVAKCLRIKSLKGSKQNLVFIYVLSSPHEWTLTSDLFRISCF